MSMDEKMDLLLEGMNVIRQDVAELKADVAMLKQEISEVKEDIAELKADVAMLKEDVAVLKVDVTVLKSDVNLLKYDVIGLKENAENLHAEIEKLSQGQTSAGESMNGLRFMVENEIYRNIKIIAEGHLDLNRKLSEVLKGKDKWELNEVRLNHAESEIRMIKQELRMA